MTRLIDESQYTTKRRLIDLSGFLTGQVYEWQKEFRERKQRVPQLYAEEVNAAVANIVAYPHIGGKKGALMLAYHHVEYIGQRCYDLVKRQLRVILLEELKQRRLLRQPAAWPKLQAKYFGEIWCADFTEVKLYGQILYVAIVLDCYSCYYLGYSVSTTADVHLVEQALIMALENNQRALPERYLVNDQGSQYKAEIYRQLLTKYQLKQKFIPPGTPWNNGEAEVGMKDIQALFYCALAQTPRGPEQEIVGQARAMAEKIFKELNEDIPRLKLKGVTPKDVKDNEAEAKRKSVEEFAAERKAARPQKTRVYNLTALIRNTLYLNARTNRWLKNIISLLNNQHDQIVPEAVG